jgi:hypothetical protein
VGLVLPSALTARETIVARCKVGVIDGALIAHRAPVPFGVFQLELIAERLVNGEAWTKEVNLDLILVRFEHPAIQIGGSD